MRKGMLIFICLLLAAALAVAALLFFLPKKDASSESEAPTVPTVTETDVTVPTETELPTEPETEAPDPYLARAEEILAGMTDYEKICQLIILVPDTITGVSPTTQAGDLSRRALEQYPVCGFSFGQDNLRTRDQVTQMLAGFRSYSKLGMMFCLDEEGGIVWRVMGNGNLGTTRLESMYNYKDQGKQTAYDNAKTIAQDISALGFNVDFAPVADVWSNPSNTVIGKRAYSDDFAQAAELIPEAVRGFHDGGVACTLKHFPGHGCTVQDSHQGLAIVDRTEEELWEEELVPFRAGIDAGADLVMVGHLKVDALDEEYPATLSHKIVTELLREKLGFDGIVITDSLGMGALNGYTETEKAVLALNAGCDILLGVRSPSTTIPGIQQAVEDGTLTMERIEESVLRILVFKLRRGIIPME